MIACCARPKLVCHPLRHRRMMGRNKRPILTTVLLWLVLSIQTATAQTFPIRNDTYVNDYASLLTVEDERVLQNTLQELFDALDIEMTVLTVNRRSAFQRSTTNEKFATDLFNHWGIGDRQRNDGVLFIVSRFDRDLRIEVGSGYGRAHDGQIKQIIDRVIIPRFQNADFATGIHTGARHTIREITGHWPGQYDTNPIIRWWTDFRVWAGGFIFAIFGIAGLVIWQFYQAARRRAPRRCPNDGLWMPRVLDEFEHKHLNDGQQTEEEMQTVDYDVWICRECGHTTITGQHRWFIKQKLCSKCGFHTLESTGTEFVPKSSINGRSATRTHFKCKHCDATSTKIKYHRDNSNSGGGFRSSGSHRSSGRRGGRSRGGGASGRW